VFNRREAGAGGARPAIVQPSWRPTVSDMGGDARRATAPGAPALCSLAHVPGPAEPWPGPGIDDDKACCVPCGWPVGQGHEVLAAATAEEGCRAWPWGPDVVVLDSAPRPRRPRGRPP